MKDMRRAVLGKGISDRNKPPVKLSMAKPNFTPVKWMDYFDSATYIETESGKHHVYSKGDKGPILMCLHGGGYSGLTWALFAKEISQDIICRVKAIDFRGHGNTKTNDDSDLSVETLTNDVVEVAKKLSEKEEAKIVLIGHSMGGAIAVHASYGIEDLAGLCVIDVVEGTALDALASMQSILRGRPPTFKSIPHAIQWCFKGGQCHNLEAARVSMPGQIVNMSTGALASDEWKTFDKLANIDQVSTAKLRVTEQTLKEVDETLEDTDETETNRTESDGKASSSGRKNCRKPPLPGQSEFKVPELSSSTPREVQEEGSKYTWRINLGKTEKYWQQWFQGLSDKFLGNPLPKILLLADIFGLDTKLTVGQMQGKFQLQVLTKTGHAVHEDQPHQVADILSIYLVKQKIAEKKEDFEMPNYPNSCC